MLLAVDVGNTETKLGFFKAAGEKLELHKTWRVTTTRGQTSDEFGVLFSALFRGASVDTGEVRAIVVSSVVPQNDRALGEACRSYFGPDPVFFSSGNQQLMQVTTERPNELGSDLLAAAIGARELYGTPLVTVGFGTATTFGAVSREGEFVGAAIAPGIRISIDALVARTAKLPQVALEAPNGPIGRDTVSALQAGIVFGFVGQAEGMLARMRSAIGEDARAVATGGLAEIVARHTRAIDVVEPHLVLLGLRRFYESQRNVV